jgi:hypothetical protein
MKKFIYSSTITITEEVEVPDDIVDVDDITEYVQDTACHKINQYLISKDIDFEWNDNYTVYDYNYHVVFQNS